MEANLSDPLSILPFENYSSMVFLKFEIKSLRYVLSGMKMKAKHYVKAGGSHTSSGVTLVPSFRVTVSPLVKFLKNFFSSPLMALAFAGKKVILPCFGWQMNEKHVWPKSFVNLIGKTVRLSSLK